MFLRDPQWNHVDANFQSFPAFVLPVSCFGDAVSGRTIHLQLISFYPSESVVNFLEKIDRIKFCNRIIVYIYVVNFILKLIEYRLWIFSMFYKKVNCVN